MIKFGPVAKSGERSILIKCVYVGSNPTRPTNKYVNNSKIRGRKTSGTI